MKSKISLIDTFAQHSFHEMFNAALLLSVISVYENVIYYGTESSIINQKKLLIDKQVSNIKYEYVKGYTGKGVWGLIIRYVYAAFIAVKIINNDDSEKIVILNNNPFLTLFYPFIKKDVNIMCHGEMELLERKDSGKLAKLMSWLLRKAFIHKPLKDNFHYIVLGDKILENLKTIIPTNNYSHFSSLDHPYIFNTIIKSHQQSEFIKIGIVGITTPTKGFSMLEQLLAICSDKVEIYHIGKIKDINSALKNMGLKIVERDENNELPREKYEEWIRQMDYILFLYPSTNYRLTASGAVFECFSIGVPIISLRNDYFDYLVKHVGEFGLLFSSFDEMKNFFVEPYWGEKADEFYEAIKRGRMFFTPDNISNKLVSVLR